MGNQTHFPNAGGAIPCSGRSYQGGAVPGDEFWANKTEQQGVQFKPPGPSEAVMTRDYPGLYFWGFGNNHNQNAKGGGRKTGSFEFSIVDMVQVPQNLEPGLHVLSHRYDCEQTQQVWTSCADILVT